MHPSWRITIKVMSALENEKKDDRQKEFELLVVSLNDDQLELLDFEIPWDEKN